MSSSTHDAPSETTHSDALVLSGVTGDLVHKKIFPALSAVVTTGSLAVPVIGGADVQPCVLLLTTGSEVALGVVAYEQLTRDGVRIRVIGMPSWGLFEGQSGAYRHSMLPPAVVPRTSADAASPLGWDCYVRRGGTSIAMRSCGVSAPGDVVEAHFAFDAAHIVAAAEAQLVRLAPSA